MVQLRRPNLKNKNIKENYSHSEYFDDFFLPNIFLLNSEHGWRKYINIMHGT